MKSWKHLATAAAAAVALAACGAEPTAPANTPDAPAARSLSTLTAEIWGSSTAGLGQQCLYEGLASGGTAPYTFTWRPGLVDGQFYTAEFNNLGPKIIELNVRDSQGNSVTVYKSVQVTSSGSC